MPWQPIIKGTLQTVESIIEYMAAGDTSEDIIKEFPELSKEDILACLAFAAKSIQLKDIEIPAA